jgi:hypothetical protein
MGTIPSLGADLLMAATVDPQPFIYRYPSGTEQRRENPPMVSRVGWRWEPREGYSQELADYTPHQQKYA